MKKLGFALLIIILICSMAACYKSCNIDDSTSESSGDCWVSIGFDYLDETNDGYKFRFHHEAHDFSGNVSTEWHIGGLTYNSDQPIVVFPECDLYEAQVTVSDGHCTASDTETIDIESYAGCDSTDPSGDFEISVQVRASQSSADITWTGGDYPFGVRYRMKGTETWLKPEESGGVVILTPPNPIEEGDGRAANINPPAGTWEVKVKNGNGDPVWSNIEEFTLTS